MSKKRQNLYFLFQFTIPWMLLSQAFLSIPHFTGVSEGRGRGIVWLIKPLIIANLIGFCLWGALFLPIFLMGRKFYSESKHNDYRNFLIHLAHGALFLIFQFTAYALVSFAPDFWARYPELLPFLKAMSLGNMSVVVTVYAVILFAIQTYLSRLRYAEEEKRTAELRSELVGAQLQALKMQIQPHFLFNTLNSISSLVLTNPQQAHQMVAQLGDFLRLTLDSTQDQLVPLAEELRFLRSYLEIEQIRFSDRLTVDFKVEPEVLSALVPHLVLQPIVENSIKHAISRRRSGGVIEIKADKFEGKLQLQIKDNGTGEEARSITLKNDKKDESNRTGLANVQNRLKHFYDNNAGFEMLYRENEGTTVTLVIPLNFEFVASQ